MTDHLGRGPGIVLVVLAVVLGACPVARAQQDVDRELKEITEAWNEGSPASREQAFQRILALEADASPAVPLLIGAMHDPDPLIRGRAAACIEQIGSAAKESVPALAQLLKDPAAAVRDAAAKALTQFGGQAEGSLGAIVESLRAPADRRCRGAAVALVSTGEPAAPAVIELLKADDPVLRRAVIEGIENTALSGSWDEARAIARAIGPLYRTLARDPEPGVRVALAKMLVTTSVGSSDEISALVDLLRDPDVEVRLGVLKAFEAAPTFPARVRGPLLELLKDGDGRVRAAAAQAIPQAELTAASVIDRLLMALKDPDPQVRDAAAEKLATARSSNARTDEHGRLVHFTTTSAALMHHPGAGRILLSALDDPWPGVRSAAAHLLPAFPAEADAAVPRLRARLLDAAPTVRASAAEALAELGPASRGAVRTLLGIVANPDDGSQEGRRASCQAAEALLAVGGDARAKVLRLLIGQLNSIDEQVRERARQMAYSLGTKLAVDLLRVLSDPRSPRSVQIEVQRLLYLFVSTNQIPQVFTASPPRPEVLAAMPAMRSLLRDADPEVRIAALALLAAIEPGNAEAAEHYLKYLRSGENPDLNDQWVGQVIKPAMIPTLIKGLEDQDEDVRFATVTVLATLAETLSRVVDRDRAEPDEHMPATAQAGLSCRRLKVQAARALLSSLKDPDVRVRWIAAETLGVLHVEAKAVVPELIEMVKCQDIRVPSDDIHVHSLQDVYTLGPNGNGGDPLRVAAIQALAGFGREAGGALPELVRAMRDEDLRVQWFAVEALGMLGPDAKAAVPALIEALRSRDVASGDADEGSGVMADGPIRLIAAFALGRIGPEARAAVPELIAALSGPDSRVRGEAAQAIGRIGPEARAAVPELIRLATRGRVSYVTEYAAWALDQLGTVAVPALLETLHDDDPDVRACAIHILNQMDAKAAVPITELARCLRDRDAGVRAAAAEALASAGDGPGAVAAVPRLIIALGDRRPDVPPSARSALIAIGRQAMPTSFAVWYAAAARTIERVDESRWVELPLDAAGR